MTPGSPLPPHSPRVAGAPSPLARPPVVASPGDSGSPSDADEPCRSSSSSPPLSANNVGASAGASSLGKRRRGRTEHYPCRGAPPRLTSPLARSCVSNNNSAVASPSRPPPIATVSSFDPSDIIEFSSRGPPPTPHRFARGNAAAAAFAAFAAGGGTAPSSTPSSSGGPRLTRHGVSSMSLVAKGLWVGDEHAAASSSRLASRGITHVLNCTDQPCALEGVAGAPTHLQLGLLDSEADLPHMQSAMQAGVEFIAKGLRGGGSVLVHCHRGISRSCTLAMAYLIWAEQRCAEQVFESLRQSRRCCDPNLLYWIAIKDWERVVLPLHLHRQPHNGGTSHLLASPPPSAHASASAAASAAAAAAAASSAALAALAAAPSAAAPAGPSALGALAVSTHAGRFPLAVHGPPSSRSPGSSAGAASLASNSRSQQQTGSSRSPRELTADKSSLAFGRFSPLRASTASRGASPRCANLGASPHPASPGRTYR